MDIELVKEITKEHFHEAVQLRRHLHQHPELSFAETETTALILKELQGIDGVTLLPQVTETGATAIMDCGKGSVILLREDIDALPMREKTGLDFSSTVENACHSCGHDIHTSALLLTARVLSKMQDKLRGKIIFLFQPAEETASGAKEMVRRGLMDTLPQPDAVVGFHVDPLLPAGTIGLIKGPANASTDGVEITVKGVGGHGAHPYRCVDPIITAAYLLTQLQSVISRENPALQPAVLTFGTIHGGTASNIIPEEVTMTGNLRAFREENRHAIWAAIQRVAEGCCGAMRAQAQTVIREGVPVLVNDPQIADELAETADLVLGEGHVRWAEQPSPGSDDFSVFVPYAPSVQFRVGTQNEDPRSALSLHNPETIYDESAIYTGAAMMAAFVVRKLS